MLAIHSFATLLVAYVVHGHLISRDTLDEHRSKRANGVYEEIKPFCTVMLVAPAKKSMPSKSSGKALKTSSKRETDSLLEENQQLTRQQREIILEHRENGRNITNREVIKVPAISEPWPGPEIACQINKPDVDITKPGAIEKTFDDDDIKGMLEALKHIMDFTCVTFIPMQTKKEHIRRSITFLKDPAFKGENSGLGRDTVGNSIKLNTAKKRGPVIHEILHSLGFIHEHARFDRDKYVKIDESNVNEPEPFRKGKDRKLSLAKNAPTYKGETYGIPYDFNSIMHYEPYQGAKDKSKPVITLKEPWRGKCEAAGDACQVGQKRGMSQSDALQVNKLFNCKEDKPISYGGPDSLVNSFPQERCRGKSCAILRG